MTTWNLTRWVALVAGVELAVRGHASDHALACYGGALLVALACVALTWATRARRVVLGAALVWVGVVAVDASLGGRAAEEARAAAAAPDPARAVAGVPESGAVAGAPGSGASPGPADAFVVLLFRVTTKGGRGVQEGRSLATRLEAAVAKRFRCRQSVSVAHAGGPDAEALEAALATAAPALVLFTSGPGLLEAAIEEDPSLHFAAPPPPGARASLLGATLETRVRDWSTARRWRAALAAEGELDALASDVADRYRALVLSARRRGADVALLIPPLSVSAESTADVLQRYERARPETRSWILAGRAHARIVRAIAGAYGLRALDTREGLDGAGAEAFTDLARLDASGRARWAETVAVGLEDRLTRDPPECARRERTGRSDRHPSVESSKG